jgi:hypothetical protein
MSLIGIWILDPTDLGARGELGDVVLELREDGRLIYMICSSSSDQIIDLRYTVDGNSIITDQSTCPKVEHTEYLLSSELVPDRHSRGDG